VKPPSGKYLKKDERLNEIKSPLKQYKVFGGNLGGK
jgi:hypothetical protein